MTTPSKLPFQLVPEIALLEPLPIHVKKRFTHALMLMHEDQDKLLSWEQIATQSAISSYHFHRQFTALFHETPGQYLSRIRLQIVVGLLMNDESLSITEIAQYCKFSSSQALAKALKRELGISAKQIRKMGHELTAKELGVFFQKLAHPSNTSSLEQELAQAMPSELIWFPQRGMKIIPFENPDWDVVLESHGEKSVRLMSATPIKHIHKTWYEMEVLVGDWKVNEEEYDFVVSEGYYLCSEVYLISDVAYTAAMDALFNEVDRQKLNIDADGVLLEFVRSIELTLDGGGSFSFQIPIKVD